MAADQSYPRYCEPLLEHSRDRLVPEIVKPQVLQRCFCDRSVKRLRDAVRADTETPIVGCKVLTQGEEGALGYWHRTWLAVFCFTYPQRSGLAAEIH